MQVKKLCRDAAAERHCQSEAEGLPAVLFLNIGRCMCAYDRSLESKFEVQEVHVNINMLLQ